MSQYILGYKNQMTQIYRENGEIVPVTIIDCDNCIVAKNIVNKSNGAKSVQLGLGINKKPSKPLKGQYNELEFIPKTIIQFKLVDVEKLNKVGSYVKVASFQDVNNINISAISKGRGFAGVIKRHG